MLKKIGGGVVFAALMLSSVANAAGQDKQGALEKGDASGVRAAASWNSGYPLGMGFAVAGTVGAGLFFVLQGNGHNLSGQNCGLPGCSAPTTTTTTTTSPTTTTTTTATNTKPSTTTTTTTTR